MKQRSLLVQQRLDIAAWQTQLRSAIYEGVSASDIKEIVESIVERAKKGDEKSLRLLFEYVLGGRQGAPQIRDSNVVIQARERRPKKPTEAPRGSAAKLDVMRRRAANGANLFHPEDAS